MLLYLCWSSSCGRPLPGSKRCRIPVTFLLHVMPVAAPRGPARPPQDEELPWERREKLQKLADESKELPFGVYLLASAIVTIAAVLPSASILPPT